MPTTLTPRRHLVLLSLLLGLTACPAARAQSTFTLAPEESQVVYEMDHPAHHWTGTSHKASGFVRFDAQGKPAEIDVRIPVLSFDSGNRNRDSHMAETVESYIFPDVHFHSTHITPAADDSARWALDGELTFHGVTKPLHTTAEVTVAPDRLTSHGSFELVLTDYDIDLPSLLMIKVKDWMKLDFDLVGYPQTHHAGG